jgi:hypothetical protein
MHFVYQPKERVMEIDKQKTVKVNAKTLSIFCKVSDRFTYSIKDEQGDEIYNQDDGYVPGFMPGNHYGDYVILDIDLDTGHVTNWKTPTAEQIQEAIKSED